MKEEPIVLNNMTSSNRNDFKNAIAKYSPTIFYDSMRLSVRGYFNNDV